MIVFILVAMCVTWLISQFGEIRCRGACLCGLSGYTGERPVDLNAMRVLLLDNQIRGRDSVGVYGRQLYRAVGAPDSIIGNSDFANAVIGAHQVVAHNRFSTRGVVSKENAHPFKVGEGKKALYGTHNGFLFEQLYDKLCEEFKLDPKPAVDSLALYQILHNSGMDFDVLSKIEAVAALAFIYDGKLHLYKRPSRPLFIGELDGGIYYSSREEGLWMIGADYVHHLEPHRMHVFDNGKLIEAPLVKKSILHYIPDTSPSMWDNHVKPEDRHNFPEIWKFAEKKQESHRYGNWTKTNTSQSENKAAGVEVLPDYSGEAAGNLNSTGGGTSNPNNREIFSELFEYVEMDLLEHSDELNLPNGKLQLTRYYDDGDLTAVYMVLALKDDVHEAPLPNWVIGIQGIPTSYVFTSARGLAILRLDLHQVKDKATGAPKQLKILVADPFNHKCFYTKDLVFERGRVVEGTLLVPFRTTETTQKTISFRTVEDNLITRAFLARSVHKNFNRCQQHPDKVKVDVEVKQASGDEGLKPGDTISLPEDTSALVEGAMRKQLLLGSTNGPKVVSEQEEVAERRSPTLFEDNPNPNDKAAEAEGQASTQGSEVLGKDKEPSYGPYQITVPGNGVLKVPCKIVFCEECGQSMRVPVTALTEGKQYCVTCQEDIEEERIKAMEDEASNMDYAQAIREDFEYGAENPAFWREVNRQVSKEKKMKDGNQRFLSPSSDIPNRQSMDQKQAQKEIHEFLSSVSEDGATVNLVRKGMVFFPFEREEDLVMYQKEYTEAQIKELEDCIHIAEQGLQGIGVDEDQLRKILGDVYSRIIKLNTDAHRDLEALQEMIDAENFLPF